MRRQLNFPSTKVRCRGDIPIAKVRREGKFPIAKVRRLKIRGCVELTQVVELYSLVLKGGDEGSEKSSLSLEVLELGLLFRRGGALVDVDVSAGAVVVGIAIVVVGRSRHLESGWYVCGCLM